MLVGGTWSEVHEWAARLVPEGVADHFAVQARHAHPVVRDEVHSVPCKKNMKL